MQIDPSYVLKSCAKSELHMVIFLISVLTMQNNSWEITFVEYI